MNEQKELYRSRLALLADELEKLEGYIEMGNWVSLEGGGAPVCL